MRKNKGKKLFNFFSLFLMMLDGGCWEYFLLGLIIVDFLSDKMQ